VPGRRQPCAAADAASAMEDGGIAVLRRNEAEEVLRAKEVADTGVRLLHARAMERRLAFHGMLLFLLGLLMGTVVQSVANPRIGLSAVLVASAMVVIGLRGRASGDSPV
jgi:hypothetical protein